MTKTNISNVKRVLSTIVEQIIHITRSKYASLTFVIRCLVRCLFFKHLAYLRIGLAVRFFTKLLPHLHLVDTVCKGSFLIFIF